MSHLERPIVQLVILSAMLFAVYVVAGPRIDNAVVITPDDADAVVQLQAQVTGRPLDLEERASAVDAAVEDELLIREAYSRGIDRGDPQVRGMLAQAVRRDMLHPDRDTSRGPTDEQLRAYYETNRDRYNLPETITFNEAFFPLGSLVPTDEREILAALRAGVEPASAVAAVGFARSGTVRNASRTSVSRSLGREFAAASVIEALLTNVYRSFDIHDEEAIYDRLALTVTGEQLLDVYLESRRALELESRGGALVRTDEVVVREVHSVRPADGGGFELDVAWTVGGSVNHFGHEHFRQNAYDALITVVPDGDTWKIALIQLLEERRVL